MSQFWFADLKGRSWRSTPVSCKWNPSWISGDNFARTTFPGASTQRKRSSLGTRTSVVTCLHPITSNLIHHPLEEESLKVLKKCRRNLNSTHHQAWSRRKDCPDPQAITITVEADSYRDHRFRLLGIIGPIIILGWINLTRRQLDNSLHREQHTMVCSTRTWVKTFSWLCLSILHVHLFIFLIKDGSAKPHWLQKTRKQAGLINNIPIIIYI
jgi:hypothetical protein